MSSSTRPTRSNGVVTRARRLVTRTRSSLRRVLWWIWPSTPTTWSAVPARLRPAVSQIARLTVASVVAYVVADAISPGLLDLTAPLTALLVVQASTVGTLRMGLVRVGAVVTGVLVAVAVTSLLGLSWWSLGVVIAISLVLAKLFRLGEQSLETPISAMLILAVTAPGAAAEVRILNTLIGTVVGIAFSLIVPVSIPNLRATDRVRRVARSQAALLDEVALSLAARAPHPDEVEAWIGWTNDIERDIEEAGAAVQAVEDSRRLNPRALATAEVHTGLRMAVERLDRCLAAERGLLLVIARAAPDSVAGLDDSSGAELRSAFAVVLDDLASALHTFGDLISAEYGGGNTTGSDELLSRTLEIVRETRAVLTELILLQGDPREQRDLWLLQSSVLAAVEQILTQLDFEHVEGGRPPWLQRHRLLTLPTVRGLSLHWPGDNDS